MKAVVMAGGEGSRLRPLTLGRPKPLLPVANAPIFEHILRLLVRHGVSEAIATLHYLGDEIKSAFGDGAEYGVRLSYADSAGPLGTAGSVKRVEAELRQGTFAVISGDALTDCDLSAALAFHRARGAVATLVLAAVQDPLEYGVVTTDAAGRVVRILEKPSWSEVVSDTVNTGIYLFEPEVLDYVEAAGPSDWSADVFPRLLEAELPVYGYVMEGYWCDIGGFEQYLRAQRDLLERSVALPMDGVDGSGNFVGAHCTIDGAAELIAPVCLGRNCRIKRGARIGPNAVLGDNAFVEEDARIDHSTLWDNVYVGPNVGIHGAIVASRATIKLDSTVREGAVVAERCFLDVGCTIRPGVKLWPDKTVERGAIVTSNLVLGSRWRGSLFRDLGATGLSNIELTPDFACRLGAAFGSQFAPHAKVATSRDGSKSSRMLKRALIAGLLSSGCEVVDLRSSALAVARHFVASGGAQAAVHVRKLPGSNRMSLIELLDERGAYLGREAERRVEQAFFREDVRRADPEELGTIQFAGRAAEAYQSDYLRLVEGFAGAPGDGPPRRIRLACDYGFSSLSGFVPPLLSAIGAEAIALNETNDARRAPRTSEEIERHMAPLQNLVRTLGCDLGVLILDDGSRFSVIDETGAAVPGPTLLATLAGLLAAARPGLVLAVSVSASSRLEAYLDRFGATVLRTKTTPRALLAAAAEAKVDLAGAESGAFMFPALGSGFDAAFGLGALLVRLAAIGKPLSELLADVPAFQPAYASVRVPWESKGAVMRQIATDSPSEAWVEHLEGIRLVDGDAWVLVLPDAIDPLVHIHAEGADEQRSRELASEFARRIEALRHGRA